MRDNLLELGLDEKWEYNENYSVCKPCIDHAKSGLTASGQSLARGSWTFDDTNKKLELVSEAANPYFVYLIPYANARGGAIEVESLRKVSKRAPDGRQVPVGMIGALMHFYYPDPNYTDLCDHTSHKQGIPIDLYGGEVENKGSAKLYFVKAGAFACGVVFLQKSCFENTTWKITSVAGRAPSPARLQNDFPLGGILCLKRQDSKGKSPVLSCTYKLDSKPGSTYSGAWGFYVDSPMEDHHGDFRHGLTLRSDEEIRQNPKV